MSKVNKIVRISLAGGIIGMLTTNPRKALEDAINSNNKDGWNAIYFSEHKTSNYLQTIGAPTYIKNTILSNIWFSYF